MIIQQNQQKFVKLSSMITRERNLLQPTSIEKQGNWGMILHSRRSLGETAVRQPDLGGTILAAVLFTAIAGCNTPPPSGSADPATESDLPADEVILQSVLDQAESQDICDGFYQPEVAAESQVYRLGDRALVELQCATAAYQSVFAYVAVQPDGTLQPLTLDVFYPDQAGQFERSSEATVGGTTSFDPETSLLTVFSKSRGLGDCGSLAEYRWTGSELELATFRYQECSDSPGELVDPADYPQIYP
ncbi:hypothetical protein C7293_18915 [filamentous cyanobacterium CCT1]|nr:hypothetical protein C7293_18915 [filamentous cyanobacterium CCT1]PSN79430.1 hypothetical protein C8B47_11670 [filamentous cyanobacterium CCP4]